MKEIGHEIFTSPVKTNTTDALKTTYYPKIPNHIHAITIRFNFHNKIILSGYETEECALAHKYCTLITATIVWKKKSQILLSNSLLFSSMHVAWTWEPVLQVQATRILDKKTRISISEGKMAVYGGIDVSLLCWHMLHAQQNKDYLFGLIFFNDTKKKKHRTTTETTTYKPLI